MFTEDLSPFFADFGVQAIAAGKTATVILDKPDKDLLSGRAQSVAYQITYQTADFPSLKYGDSITVAGVAYTVLETSTIDDGQISTCQLQRT
jgi:riboflavin synthase alpha subunit